MFMNIVQEHGASCPYCGEHISLLIDCSDVEQTYTEDCQVCCQPMVVEVQIVDEVVQLYVGREDD
jgi:transcription elongation factor Elf1